VLGRERLDEQGRGVRRGERRAQTLHGPHHDQPPQPRHDGAQRRGDDEDERAGPPGAGAAVHVPGPPGRQQRRGADEQERRHGPLHLVQRRAEVALQHRQRHLHRGPVEDDHEGAARDGEQRRGRRLHHGLVPSLWPL
jgi:hypothetical protein